MEGRDAGAFEGARGRLRIERVAVAGIGVGDERHLDDIDHRSEPVDDRAHRDKPRSGTPAERAIAPPLA